MSFKLKTSKDATITNSTMKNAIITNSTSFSISFKNADATINDALLNDDGSPILNDDGSYILTT